MDTFVRNFVRHYANTVKRWKASHLLKLLSAIEYAEAVLEITAGKLFGARAKWLIVLLIQLCKCVVRLQLLIVHRSAMQTPPSLFTLLAPNANNASNRRSPFTSHALPSSSSTTTTPTTTATTTKLTSDPDYFVLNNSGRIVRSINSAPNDLDERDWSMQGIVAKANRRSETDRGDKSSANALGPDLDPSEHNSIFIAELLHIIRPISHLSCILLFSEKSWTQFTVPLVIDTVSLLLARDSTAHMSKTQREEMRRRAILFLHYFIRSPFYEACSSSVINVALAQFEQRLPGMRFVTGPIKSYIPYWQSVYNYCWSS